MRYDAPSEVCTLLDPKLMPTRPLLGEGPGLTYPK